MIIVQKSLNLNRKHLKFLKKPIINKIIHAFPKNARSRGNRDPAYVRSETELFNSFLCINFNSMLLYVKLVEILEMVAVKLLNHLVPHLIKLCIVLSEDHLP